MHTQAVQKGKYEHWRFMLHCFGLRDIILFKLAVHILIYQMVYDHNHLGSNKKEQIFTKNKILFFF